VFLRITAMEKVKKPSNPEISGTAIINRLTGKIINFTR
jgi:hypothetical protein